MGTKSRFARTSLAYIFLVVLSLNAYKLRSQPENSEKVKLEIKNLREHHDFSPNDIAHIDLLIKLGRSMVYINSDTLLKLGSEIKKLSESIHYSEGLVAAEITLANAHVFAGNGEQAILKCDEAIASALKEGVHHLVARGYITKGIGWFKLNNYAESFLSFQAALKHAKKYDDYVSMSTAYMNMATMFSLLGDYEEALSIYNKALEIELPSVNTLLRSEILSNIAFLQINLGDFKNAMKNVDSSIASFKQNPKPAWLSFCYTIKGKIFLAEKNYEKALESFDKSKKIHDTIQDAKGLADVSLSLSKTYYGLKQYERAESEALKSLDLYYRVNLRTGVLDAYSMLAQIKERLNYPKGALFYMKKAHALSDSISKHDKSSKVSLIRAKTIFDENQNQIKEENLAEIEIHKKYISVIFFAFLGSLVLLFLIFKANGKVKKANKQLAKQSKDLKESKESLQEINSMKDKLFSIIGHDFRGPIAHLKQLLQMAADEYLRPEELKYALVKLRHQTENIHFTLDNLLSWGKTQMEGFKIAPENVDLTELISQNIEFFKERLSKKDITVNIDFKRHAYVWADKNLVDLVLRNLISNAIKFSYKKGEICISGSIDGNRLIVRIQDHGVGFQHEALKQLFHKNRHHSTYGTLNEKGTGLGLVFCKEAITVNLGELWIKSEPSVKTEIFFSLPRTAIDSNLSGNIPLKQPEYA